MSSRNNGVDGTRQASGLEPSKLKDHDVLYKALILGESAVGKTALVQKYTSPDRKFSPNLLPTIGIDYRTVIRIIDGLRVKVQLWDTVGQERYRTMTKMFFRGAKGVLLVYDVTNRDSFNTIQDWMESLKKFSLDQEEVILIGNKIDLHYRDVSKSEGSQLATSLGIKYFETSAKTGENVSQVFEQLIYDLKDANNPLQQGPIHVIDNEQWEEIFANHYDERQSNEINLKYKDKTASSETPRERTSSFSKCCSN